MPLHDLKLVDLFDAAALLGYEAEACAGNAGGEPIACRGHRGADSESDAALPLLMAGELARLGSPLRAQAQIDLMRWKTRD